MRSVYRFFSTLSMHLPAARWCLAVIVISFVSVVSVYKYIDMSDMAVFSSLETMYLIQTDTMNTVFIYFPLYLFIVSGIMFDDGFGETGILRFRSRREWTVIKALVYAVNTVLFFGVILLINFVVSSQVFSYSEVWSGDFVGFCVMMGQPASDFSASPVMTITAACISAFMLYLFCGLVNMLVSLISGRESVGLFVSLIVGIGIGIAGVITASESLSVQVTRISVLLAASVITFAVSLGAAGRKNFSGKKMY